MQINKIGINNSQLISFKANYFTVIKEGKAYRLLKISTDNEENLGKEPVLEYQSSCKKFEFPMTYDGKYYTTYVYPHTDNYRIFYKDTGKYENNGEKQIVNPLCLARKATIADRTSNDLPIEEVYSKGETVGKVIYTDSIDSGRQYSKTLPKDVPIILLLGQVKQNSYEVLNHLPENVKGVIVHNSGFSVLGHIANQIRQNLLVMSTVWDNDKFNDLKKYEGKFIHINN